MPIYEYACNGCGHRFEVFQKMSDPPPSLCPSCGAEQVRKLVSTTSFVLKGGGWYKDHYGLKSGGDSTSEGSKAASSASASSGGESGGASTPAAPAASTSTAPASTGSSGASTSSGASSAAPAKP